MQANLPEVSNLREVSNHLKNGSFPAIDSCPKINPNMANTSIKEIICRTTRKILTGLGRLRKRLVSGQFIDCGGRKRPDSSQRTDCGGPQTA
jgi:hypothetical protein